MPSLDVIDVLNETKAAIVKAAGGEETLVGQLAESQLSELALVIDDERKDWERTLALVMDEDRDFEDYVI